MGVYVEPARPIRLVLGRRHQTFLQPAGTPDYDWPDYDQGIRPFPRQGDDRVPYLPLNGQTYTVTSSSSPPCLCLRMPCNTAPGRIFLARFSWAPGLSPNLPNLSSDGEGSPLGALGENIVPTGVSLRVEPRRERGDDPAGQTLLASGSRFPSRTLPWPGEKGPEARVDYNAKRSPRPRDRKQ